MEYCIERGLAIYEAGAQGEHKIPSGFEPTLTWSIHALFHPTFRNAVARFVVDEAEGIARLFEEYAAHSPNESPRVAHQ